MGDVWGRNIKLSIFGESHGKAIGVVIDGLPSGFEIDMDQVNFEMSRRVPGKNQLSTARKESDSVDIVSGFFEGKTTGTALCGIIYNQDMRSKDYSKIKNIIRPSHADYNAFVKYNGFQDYRGGGHFSGRITAPIVFAGAIFKQILSKKGIDIFGRVKSISNVKDKEISYVDLPEKKLFEEILQREIPALGELNGRQMKEAIIEAKSNGDSVGGVVEVFSTGIPTGYGDPFFDSIESSISHLAFSVPAVKGIEFGAGFEITKKNGSEVNDCYYLDDNKIKTRTNNNGGIVGGISTGMPLVFRVAIKPTPSIYKDQETVNIEEMKNTTFKVEGRHDPCVVIRALPVIESVAAIALADYIL